MISFQNQEIYYKVGNSAETWQHSLKLNDILFAACSAAFMDIYGTLPTI